MAKAKAKAEDLKGKSADELKTALLDARKAQFNMRFQRSQGALENTAQIRRARREIARIKTLLNTQKQGSEQGKMKAKAPVKKETAAKTKKSGTKAAQE